MCEVEDHELYQNGQEKVSKTVFLICKKTNKQKNYEKQVSFLMGKYLKLIVRSRDFHLWKGLFQSC